MRKKPMSVDFTISGGSVKSRIRLNEAIVQFLADNGMCYGGYSNLNGIVTQRMTSEDKAKTFKDMSVDACMSRYQKRRDEILASVANRTVSASMSGIDYYPCDAIDLEGERQALKIALTWNGQRHIQRPEWDQEYLAWKASKRREQ